jgi:toxin CcdB
MPQFAVYRNPSPATRKTIPLLLDVQSELLDALSTCVVVPLYIPAAVQDGVIGNLMPLIEFDGKRYIAVIPELAGIPRKSLGADVGDLAHRRHDLSAALDLLLTGI